jgi:hypothetical protein
MKEIMAKYSSEENQGVASFGYCPTSNSNNLLFEFNRRMDELQNMLIEQFAGQTLTTRQIYDLHNVGRPYTMKNYKTVLLEMEKKQLIQADPPSTKRKKNTFGDHVSVTFPAFAEKA